MKHLPNGFIIHVSRQPLVGDRLSFSVVLVKDDLCITRFDTAHGFVHRDVIGGKRKKLIKKEKYDNMSDSEAFEYAINDLQTNYEKYYEYYETH